MSGVWDTAVQFSAEWHRGEITYRIGDIVSMGSGEPFNDCVIIGFALSKHRHDGENGTWYARVARPYAYADTIGCVPNHLLGSEVFELTCDHMTRMKHVHQRGDFSKGSK